MATSSLADLLAGVLDLAPATPPHPPGPCDALCVPSCTGRGGGDTGYRAPETDAVLAAAVRPPTSPKRYATAT
jgi:hypothetical protein